MRLEINGRPDKIILGRLIGVDMVGGPDAQLNRQDGGLPGLESGRGRNDADLDDRIVLAYAKDGAELVFLGNGGRKQGQDEPYEKCGFFHGHSLKRQAIL